MVSSLCYFFIVFANIFKPIVYILEIIAELRNERKNSPIYYLPKNENIRRIPEISSPNILIVLEMLAPFLRARLIPFMFPLRIELWRDREALWVL